MLIATTPVAKEQQNKQSESARSTPMPFQKRLPVVLLPLFFPHTHTHTHPTALHPAALPSLSYQHTTVLLLLLLLHTITRTHIAHTPITYTYTHHIHIHICHTHMPQLSLPLSPQEGCLCLRTSKCPRMPLLSRCCCRPLTGFQQKSRAGAF